MSDTVILAIIASIPATITAVASLFVAMKSRKQVSALSMAMSKYSTSKPKVQSKKK